MKKILFAAIFAALLAITAPAIAGAGIPSVPEPATAPLLLGAGVVAIGFTRWQKKRNKKK